MIKDRGGSGLTSPNSPTNSSGGGLTVEDVFHINVRNGTGVATDIVTGVNGVDNDVLVWLKSRSAAKWHWLVDTLRGSGTTYPAIHTNSTQLEGNTGRITGINADGFSLGTDAEVNGSGETYVDYTFAKAPRFFDVVKYTGNGVAGREIPHELGCDVGMIILKPTNDTQSWRVYHKAATNKYGVLESTNVFYNDDGLVWGDGATHIPPTDTVFTVNNLGTVSNGLGTEYIAYLFAHNETDGLVEGDGKPVIKCGSYVGNGSTDGPEIDLGFEPQYVMIKGASITGGWQIYDTIRGIVTGYARDSILYSDSSSSEFQSTHIELHPNGFKLANDVSPINSSGATYIYMAIARDTTTVPTSSDEVFAIDTGLGEPSYTSGFPVDMAIKRRSTSEANWLISSRLTQGMYMWTNTSDLEQSASSISFNWMDGWKDTGDSSNEYSWMFKRAYSFFDVVTYTGDGVAGRTVEHNLGVVPEMIWVKRRDNTTFWAVQHKDISNVAQLDSNLQAQNWGFFNNAGFTDELFQFGLSLGGSGEVNGSTRTYIAYLFATLDGISKVGSYTGNGTTQTINAGFTTGAKFIIIKRTNSTGDWIMVDSTRGLDNFLELNTTNTQASGSGITVDASGFNVTQNGTTDLNASGGEYIYYAIAEGV
jgi:hypothetical protein